MKRRAAIALAITVALLGAAAAFFILQLTRPGGPTPASASVCQASCHYVGVALTFQSQDHLMAFEDDTRFHPGIVATSEPFGQPFPSSWAHTLLARGILPLIVLNPRQVPPGAIAKGRYDGPYLRQYAATVRALDAPVALAFGSDPNGSWNPWGYNSTTSPGVFVKAWRHIHQVFAEVGARKVIWVWEVTRIRGTPRERGVAPNPRPWWPGGAYVDWVGLDIFYQSPATTFQGEFVPSITAVRRFTDDPILLKTAVPDQSGQVRQIADLFAGARASDLLGVVWYDQNGPQTWQLDKSRRAAIAAFRRGAASLLASR